MNLQQRRLATTGLQQQRDYHGPDFVRVAAHLAYRGWRPLRALLMGELESRPRLTELATLPIPRVLLDLFSEPATPH